MLKVLLVDNSDESILIVEKELQKTIKNVEVTSTKTYKDGMKAILKYGNKISLCLFNHGIEDSKEAKFVEILESNNIKTIVLCDHIDNLPSEGLLEKDCVIDCIIKYYDSGITNIVNSANRILTNIDKNILVVEDSKIQLSVLTKILNKMNLNVTTAHDGVEALQIIQDSDKKFDLVLTDYNMPNMDGMQLTFKIREEYDKDEVGIIVLSSNNQPEIAAQFLKIGANDFINKPYNETEVITRINSNLDLIELFTKTKDMANKDFLTGAYNRRYFFEAASNILKKSRRNNTKIALAMIDIDKFKNINDTYGHHCGDIVICEVVTALQEYLRDSDLMARFGGEEFCVVLDEVSQEDTMVVFEKIRDFIENRVTECEGHTITYTASIGLYYGIDGALEDMIKIADEALYYCKENGRNQVHLKIAE